MSHSKSYSQILKSSSMVGGSQFIKILIGIVQTKFAAVYLGPAGVGLIGAYQSIIQLGSAVSSFGINKSGVRDVAVAAGSNDQQTLARTVKVLRRMCWLTGIAGAIGLAALAFPISKLTFGDSNHQNALIFLSLIILFMSIAQGQLAVIQGLRRISDLVKVQIYASFAGAGVSIALYYKLGMAAIVPSLIAVAFFNLIAAWWFSRKISLPPVSLNLRRTFSQAKGLLGLGSAFMISGLSATFMAYAVRAIISRDIGVEGLGMYQAAFYISGHVLTFVLGAIAVDFYPRLAGVANNHNEMARLVNEQTEIGLLLGTPAIIGILGLAPLAISLLYTSSFYPAIGLLRWFALGCFVKLVSWPLAYIQIALGKQYWLISTEVFFSVMHVVFLWIGLHIWGLAGAAIAFFAVYTVHMIGIKMLASHLIDFSWSHEAKLLILTQVTIVLATFVMFIFLKGIWSIIIGLVIFVLVGIHSLRRLILCLGKEHKVYRFIIKIPLLNKLLCG